VISILIEPEQAYFLNLYKKEVAKIAKIASQAMNSRGVSAPKLSQQDAEDPEATPLMTDEKLKDDRPPSASKPAHVTLFGYSISPTMLAGASFCAASGGMVSSLASSGIRNVQITPCSALIGLQKPQAAQSRATDPHPPPPTPPHSTLSTDSPQQSRPLQLPLRRP
jgi:hypothetical protein